jgi:hypothetical protein
VIAPLYSVALSYTSCKKIHTSKSLNRGGHPSLFRGKKEYYSTDMLTVHIERSRSRLTCLFRTQRTEIRECSAESNRQQVTLSQILDEVSLDPAMRVDHLCNFFLLNGLSFEAKESLFAEMHLLLFHKQYLFLHYYLL